MWLVAGCHVMSCDDVVSGGVMSCQVMSCHVT